MYVGVASFVLSFFFLSCSIGSLFLLFWVCDVVLVCLFVCLGGFMVCFVSLVLMIVFVFSKCGLFFVGLVWVVVIVCLFCFFCFERFTSCGLVLLFCRCSVCSHFLRLYVCLFSVFVLFLCRFVLFVSCGCVFAFLLGFCVGVPLLKVVCRFLVYCCFVVFGCMFQLLCLVAVVLLFWFVCVCACVFVSLLFGGMSFLFFFLFLLSCVCFFFFFKKKGGSHCLVHVIVLVCVVVRVCLFFFVLKDLCVFVYFGFVVFFWSRSIVCLFYVVVGL